MAGVLEINQLGGVPTVSDVKFNQVISPSGERVIVIVDRTADIPSAAKALATARLSFGATSPYAPDVVLVNEFVKKEFLEAIVKSSVRFLTGADGANGDVNGISNGQLNSAKKPATEKLSESDRVVASGSSGTIVFTERRDSPLLRQKIGSSTIVVHAVSSLDDAIDFSNGSGSLLATYSFADPASAKYLTQFINARASFVNHIPTQILVGPATPMEPMAKPTNRYPHVMFKLPTPIYCQPPPLSNSLGTVLTSQGKKEIEALNTKAALLPKLAKRPPGGIPGFFEQAILIALGMFGFPVIAGVVFAGYKAVSWKLCR